MDSIDACGQRPPIDPEIGICFECQNWQLGRCVLCDYDGREPVTTCGSFDPVKPQTRKQALARIQAEQLEIFLSRDTTRGSHDIDVLTCAVLIRDKANRLLNQWKDGRLEYDPEELLDIANYAIIALMVMRGEWRLPWEVGE